MKTHRFKLLKKMVFALALALVLSPGWAMANNGGGTPPNGDPGDDGGRPVIELEETAVYIEWNSTDTDYGIQFFWDSEGFTRMTIRNESGQVALDVQTKQNVREQGLTEGFFESVEPLADEVSMEEFFARFPEGTYDFRGISIDNEWLLGEAEFTHILPAPPVNLSPTEGEIVSPLGFTASFNPVTQDTEGNPIEIEYYTVVVEKIEDEPILQTFTVILPPDQTSVEVPAEFLGPDTAYKLEVIAQEAESGNRTITETGEFTTAAE